MGAASSQPWREPHGSSITVLRACAGGAVDMITVVGTYAGGSMDMEDMVSLWWT